MALCEPLIGGVLGGVFCWDDGGGDALAPFFIGQANDGDFEDMGVTEEGFFDFSGGDFVATALEDVDALSTDVDDVALVIHPNGISGEEPAIVESLGGFLGEVPVTAQERGAAHGELANIAGLNRGEGIVEDTNFDAIDGLADGAGSTL